MPECTMSTAAAQLETIKSGRLYAVDLPNENCTANVSAGAEHVPRATRSKSRLVKSSIGADFYAV